VNELSADKQQVRIEIGSTADSSETKMPMKVTKAQNSVKKKSLKTEVETTKRVSSVLSPLSVQSY